MKRKSLLVASTAAIIGTAGVLGGGFAVAQAATTTSNDNLATKIAQKFNLKPEDVQKVLDENRAAHEAEHQARLSTNLNQLVTDGKLTTAQKDLILAKQKELATQREADHTAMESKTQAERKALMDQKRTELEQWAKANNIPTEYLRYVMGGHGRGHGPM